MLKKPGFSHSYKAVATGSALLLCLCLATQAQAGPRIEFGEDGGFLQVDLKGQVYVENTSYGGGKGGDESRTDIHFMRNRLGMTGMLDETWGYKFQTCGNTGTSKQTLGYALSAQDTRRQGLWMYYQLSKESCTVCMDVLLTLKKNASDLPEAVADRKVLSALLKNNPTGCVAPD